LITKVENSLAQLTIKKYHHIMSINFTFVVQLFLRINILAYFAKVTITKKWFIAKTSALEQLHLGCELIAQFTFDEERQKKFWRDRHF
jgi:hypothetical protein